MDIAVRMVAAIMKMIEQWSGNKVVWILKQIELWVEPIPNHYYPSFQWRLWCWGVPSVATCHAQNDCYTLAT